MNAIETNKPVIPDPEQVLQKIATFWDVISGGWEKIMGPHIHHGYYENDQSGMPQSVSKQENLSSLTPQERIIQKIIETIPVEKGQKILDVGCGMGGSAVYLAKQYQATVLGISLSKKQVAMATKAAELQQLNQVSFQIDNAHTLEKCEDRAFDLVWSLESCEQFYDKALFLEQAYRVLKPGGKLMIATWCANQENYTGALAKRYISLCKAFDLPYMPTEAHYLKLLQDKFVIESHQDWSPFVKNSWAIGIQQIKQYSWFKLFNWIGLQGLSFARSLQMMSDAFVSGQLRYVVFVAIKK